MPETVTKVPTSTPLPTRHPERIPRPTLLPVNTHAKRAQTITSSLGQQVDVIVTGFDDSPLRFEHLVTAINEGERLLGVPYPSPVVSMTRVDELTGGFCGHNQMSYAPRYSGEPYVVDGSFIELRVDEDCFKPFDVIVHEVAHTWFHGSDYANWIDEGLANSIENQVVETHHTGDTIYPPVTYCETYSNIKELERSNPVKINEDPYTGFSCNYSLGDGVFGALLEHFGEMEFNSRIGKLARRLINQSDRGHSIADVRNALGTDSRVLAIISTWYEGYPQMRKYRHLDEVEWNFPPTIDGEYLHFAGTTKQSGLVHDFVLGNDSYCSQFVLREGIGDQEWVQNVSRPLPAGRTHHVNSKVITINHEINPSTGRFEVTAKILDNSLADIGDLSLSVKERVTTGEGDFCDESITFAQIPVVKGNIPVELKQARYFHLDAVEWTFPPTIDGDYLHFAGKASDPHLVYDFVPSDKNNCSQFRLYRNYVNQEFVASVASPLLAGTTHSSVPSVAVINFDISPGTGDFSVTAKLTDRNLAGIRDLSLAISSLESTSTDGLCDLRDSYSQAPVVAGSIPAELKTAQYLHLDAVEWTFLPTIDGEYLHFAGRTREPGLVHDFVLEGDPYCSQFVLYRNVVNQEWVASVSAPLLVGWTHREIPKVVVVDDKINPDTGEFSITARVNDRMLYQTPELSLLVRGRELVGSNNLCGRGDSYSQIAVSIGQIPAEMKMSKHYHLDGVEWIVPPTISGNTLSFRGRAHPGTIALEWRDGYCGQFSLYERDESGYHFIDSLNSFLPSGRRWAGTITGEITRYNIAQDGTFEATASLMSNALSGYDTVILVVRTLASVDPGSRKCGSSDVISAIDIH